MSNANTDPGRKSGSCKNATIGPSMLHLRMATDAENTNYKADGMAPWRRRRGGGTQAKARIQRRQPLCRFEDPADFDHHAIRVVQLAQDDIRADFLGQF